MSEKLMNEEVDEVTQQSDVDVLPGSTLFFSPLSPFFFSLPAGVHVCNPRLFENRSTSSNVRKAGALVPPPSCLGGGPHGWVAVSTHSTPVLTSVRRLWVA